MKKKTNKKKRKGEIKEENVRNFDVARVLIVLVETNEGNHDGGQSEGEQSQEMINPYIYKNTPLHSSPRTDGRV